MLIKKKAKKRIKLGYLVNVRSRHPSHKWLKQNIGRLPFKSIVRLGSTTEIGDEISHGGNRIECNTVQSVINSSNKLLMKQCFDNYGVKTAFWFTVNPKLTGFTYHIAGNPDNCTFRSEIEYPIVAKHVYGSRNTGNYLIRDNEEFDQFITNRFNYLHSYIFEKYYSYNREYRIHMAMIGNKHDCIYTCRKVLKSNTPEDQRWFRNDSNSAWYVEDNPKFNKPVNWNDIIDECGKAMRSLGLDIGAFDVRVQSANNKDGELRDNPEFIIIESNSAASHGDITREKYQEAIPMILWYKFNAITNLNNLINGN